MHLAAAPPMAQIRYGKSQADCEIRIQVAFQCKCQYHSESTVVIRNATRPPFVFLEVELPSWPPERLAVAEMLGEVCGLCRSERAPVRMSQRVKWVFLQIGKPTHGLFRFEANQEPLACLFCLMVSDPCMALFLAERGQPAFSDQSADLRSKRSDFLRGELNFNSCPFRSTWSL